MTSANQQFDRRESSALQAAVSGGLNTASSDLLTPLEMSPDMNNVQVDFDQMVRKRKGYKNIFSRINAGKSLLKGSFIIGLQTSTGRPMMMLRENTSLLVYIYDSTGWVLHTEFNNVFSSISGEMMDFVSLNETLYSRVVMVRRTGVPIQFSYFSTKITFTKGGTSATWSGIELPPTFAAVTNLIFIVNGTNAPVSVINSVALTNNNTILSINTTASFNAGTYTLELIAISWQWWAEAIQVKGNQLIQATTQAVGPTVVTVPSQILNGISPIQASFFIYPFHTYQSINYDNIFNRVLAPTLATEYYYTAGGSAAGGLRVNPAPTQIAFGAAAGANRNVIFARGYLLPFYGGSGPNLQTTALDVIPYYGANVCARYAVAPPSEGGAGVGTTPQGFTLRARSNYGVITSTANSRQPAFLAMDATTTAGGGLAIIPSDEIYHIIDVNCVDLQNNSALGSNATNVSISRIAKNIPNEYPPVPVTSYGFPVFGISWISDYKRKSFPSCIGTIQGRIVLGGFSDQPLHIVLSNPYDSDAPGYFSNNFDFVYTSASDVSPFDLIIAGNANDRVTAFLEFNDSLFVFTQNQVVRVHASGELLTYANTKYAVIANIGIVNQRCKAVIEDYPVFLSTSGLYAIIPDDTAAGYGIQELSENIRNTIQSYTKTLDDVGFLVYDASRSELYVGLSNNVDTDRCGILLVYNTRLKCWYKYTAHGGSGFQAYGGTVYSDNREGVVQPLSSVLFTVPDTYNTSDNYQIVEMNQDDIPFDVHQTWTYAGVPFTTKIPAKQVSITTTLNILEYTPDDVPTFKEKAFTLCPIRDLQDVEVTLNGVTQVFGTDYIKTHRGSIILTVDPGNGKTLVLTSRMKYEGTLYHPVALMSTAGYVYKPTEYTTDISGNFYRITSVTPVPGGGTTFYLGCSFPSWYTTPTFNRATLNVKRIKEYIGYYQNTDASIWRHLDTYPLASRVGKRKFALSVNLGVLYSNEYEGYLQEELYNDIDPSTPYPNQQLKDYVRISVPIVGGGYNIKVVHHNNTPASFKLAGYELKAIAKQGKGYSKSEESIN